MKKALHLSLYILDETLASVRAVKNVKRLCDGLAGRCKLEIIDLAVNPEAAKKNEIVAVSTLIRKPSPPGKRIIGDLGNEDRVLKGLGLQSGD